MASGRAKKISVTVDEGVLRDVSTSARKAKRTLSAYITEALARDLRTQRLKALVEEFEHEHGAITERELAKVRASWRG
jgi:hypothetical protein